MRYSVAMDYDYTETHKRERLTIWSPPFASTFEGTALSLLGNTGYMVTTYNGDKFRVVGPCPRTDANYDEVDAALAAALNAHHEARGARPLVSS